jgi:hypothetical protein
MPFISGYASVNVDVSDFSDEVEINFYNLADVISAAEDNNYTLEEIVDYCFEHGLNISDYLMYTLSHEQFTTIYKRAVINYMDELELKISNQKDTIAELSKKLKDLEDAEALKDVAY